MKKIVLLLFLAVSMVASAQMIGATNNRGSYNPMGDSYGQRPTGSLIHLEGGTTTVVGYGYQMKPNLMIGGGIGYNIFEVMPVYAEFRWSQPRYDRAFFVDFKLGLDLLDDDLPFVGMFQLGMLFKHFGVGFGLGMAPELEYSSRGNSGLFNISLSYDLPL